MCSRQDARFIESCGADPRRVAVLPQSAPDAFLGAVEPMTPKRLQTVLYVGQHAFVKAPMVVAAAMDNVATQHPGASFIWVTGKEHHERVRAMVRPETRARLQLLGWMEQSRLKEIFDRAGIFLFPSFFEGSGKAHLEALSRGLCVVASGVGGMLDTIEDGVSGALAPPGDPAAVARRVLELMHDERSAGRMAEAAARRARELSWRRTALETADFYQRIIELNTKR
jgi:D-inositol-3-phosphate glycosyltransferase